MDTDTASYPIRVLYGINGAFEVGGGFVSSDDSDAWGINGKWVTPLTLGAMPWAVGAQYVDFTDWDEKVTQVYFVGTKALTAGSEGAPALNGTIGVNWTKDEWDGGDNDAIRGFVGLEAAFANKMTLSAEYTTKNDDFDDEALWAAKGTYPITPALTVEVGVGNGTFWGTDESKMFAACLSYAFNLPSAE